jgi:transmembrane sensor
MPTKDPGQDIREQAARWVDRMIDSQDSLSAVERDEFNEWIADPLHAQEFHAIHTIVAMTADLPVAERARLSEWASRHREDDRTHSRRQVMRWWGIAASLIAVLVLGGYYAQSRHWFGESYVTRTGETRVVAFQEGSVAYLNTRTEVRWVGSERDRRVELADGEALFDVVHDENRPFRVTLDNSEIRVLGTRFNVYRKPGGDTTVTVLEGTVEVRGFGSGAQPQWVRTIHTNEQIEYRAIGVIREPHVAEAQKTVLWRNRVYKFEDESIQNVVNELTRYTDQRILIRDPRIATARIGGALSTRDIRGSLKRLEAYARVPMEVQENNNTFTLDYRAEAGKRKD